MDGVKSIFGVALAMEVNGNIVALGFDWTHAHWFSFVQGLSEGLDQEGWSLEVLKFYVRYINLNKVQ